jgi:hypothetical protein
MAQTDLAHLDASDSQGAEVIGHGRDAARGQVVVDAITAEGGKARFVAGAVISADGGRAAI